MSKAGWSLSIVLMLIASVAVGQDPTPPKPSPEHEFFKQLVGTWDADVKMEMGGQAMTSKATTTSRLDANFWLVTEHKGSFAGAPFVGLAIEGYDPAKKKTVGTWVDSMSPVLFKLEGEWDKSGKKHAGTMEGTDPSGKPMKWKTTTEFKDKDNYVFILDPQAGGEMGGKMTITYKRKK